MLRDYFSEKDMAYLFIYIPFFKKKYSMEDQAVRLGVLGMTVK